MKEIVVDEALEQVDVESALDGGPLRDEIDATEIGSAVGRQVGEQLGRSIGEELGTSIQETVSTSLEEGRSFRGFISDLVRAIREALTAWLEDLGLDGIASGVTPAVGETTDDVEEDAETDVDEADVDETREETEEEEDEEKEESADEAAEDEDEAADEVEGEPDVDIDDNGVPDIDTLEDLRRDALEDVLEMVSYRDLQSIAKEVGVKANLEGSEMRNRIVDAVTNESETVEETA